MTRPIDLIALVGSRICHDLVNPLGAIGNGVELLAMAGGTGPEVTLITESVASASARVRFFRLAFGAAGPGQGVGRAEVVRILDALTRVGRLKMSWDIPGEAPRQHVKVAFLALMCLETAMPYGGEAAVRADGALWRVRGTAPRLKVDPALWGALSGESSLPEITPAEVQFALLPQVAEIAGLTLKVNPGEGSIEIGF